MKEKTWKVTLLVLFILIVFVVVLELTSAYMKPTVETTSVSEVSLNSCAKLSLIDSGTSINMPNTAPMSDNKGLNTTPYEFTIKSSCDVSLRYKVYLGSLSTNTLDASNIKYAIKEKTSGKTISEGKLTTEGTSDFTTDEITQAGLGSGGTVNTIYTILDTTIHKQRERTYELYLWVDKDADNENMQKSFIASVMAKKIEEVEPDLTVATTYNGTTGVPPVVGATAALTCAGTDATYNNKYNRIEIVPSSKTKCTLTYTPRTTKEYLNQKIISLSGTTQGTGQVVNENGYRYEGKNPNNYVWFNNELWRIIGVFDENSHGKTGENLVKIIRENSLGGLAWDKSNTNNWETSSLKALLNGTYYNKEDGTESGYCYGYSTSVQSNCDYTSIGIDSSYRSMIKNVTWYLGGYSSNSVTSEAMYGYERGTTVYSGRPTSGEGYIGLMYPSDYGYSVLASSCARTTNLSSYSNATCAGQSWLYKEGIEWTISPSSSNSSSVFYVYYNGNLFSSSANYGYAHRPVLYLDALVYVMDGDGSMNDPYIIGMG